MVKYRYRADPSRVDGPYRHGRTGLESLRLVVAVPSQPADKRFYVERRDGDAKRNHPESEHWQETDDTTQHQKHTKKKPKARRYRAPYPNEHPRDSVLDGLEGWDGHAEAVDPFGFSRPAQHSDAIAATEDVPC